MGVYTAITGSIDINPPIPLSTLQAESPYLAAKHNPGTRASVFVSVDLVFALEHDAALGEQVAVAIVPAFPAARKIGNPAEEINAIIDAYGRDREFAGELDLETEYSDTCRISLREGRAVWSEWEMGEDESDDDDWSDED